MIHRDTIINSHFFHSMSQSNYSIVQCSFEEDDSYLCVLPSSWIVRKGWNNGAPDKFTKLEGGDMCYWPAKAAGYRLLEKAKKNPNVGIDANLLLAYRCKIKRIGFKTYNDVSRNLASKYSFDRFIIAFVFFFRHARNKSK